MYSPRSAGRGTPPKRGGQEIGSVHVAAGTGEVMWLVVLIACSSEPAPPEGAGPTTTWSSRDDSTAPVGDSADRLPVSTADSAAEALSLVLLHDDDGSEVLPGQPARWTMWHGPAGGWSLTPRGLLSRFEPGEEVFLTVEADVTSDGMVFTSFQPVYAISEADGLGRVTLGTWPEVDVRLHADPWPDLHQICPLAEAPAELSITVVEYLDDIASGAPQLEGRRLERTLPIELQLDSMDVELCEEP